VQLESLAGAGDMYSSGLGWMRTARVGMQQCGIPVFFLEIDVSSGGCFDRVVAETGEIPTKRPAVCVHGAARDSPLATNLDRMRA
jgi:hypothetical protein